MGFRRNKQRNKRSSQARPPRPQVRKNPPLEHYTVPVPPKDSYDPCPISGEPIDNIFLAIADPDSGKPARFDTVIDLLSKREEIGESQRLVYIGAGNFGIIENIGTGNKQRIELVKKIPYEDPYQAKPWRRRLSPGISRDYIPEPKPLGDLYSREELQSFPKLGASAIVKIN